MDIIRHISYPRASSGLQQHNDFLLFCMCHVIMGLNGDKTDKVFYIYIFPTLFHTVWWPIEACQQNGNQEQRTRQQILKN